MASSRRRSTASFERPGSEGDRLPLTVFRAPALRENALTDAAGKALVGTTDGEGRFHFEGLPSGNAQVTANLEGYYYKPRIDKELLSRHAEGLIGLSGCLASEVPEMIIKDQPDRARAAIDWFKQVLGPENFYLELQNHGIPEQAKVNRSLIPWAKEFGLKCVASNDVHYVERGHWRAHDCLICIGTQSQLTDSKRMRYQPEQFYLRSGDEMKALFHEVPDAVLNTVEIGRASCRERVSSPV